MDSDNLQKLIYGLGKDSLETAQALLKLVEERRGSVPLALRMLEQRPDMLLPQAIKLLARSRALDPKVAELTAVAAAAALGNESTLRSHMEQALAKGASPEEVLETLLIAATVAESSIQAMSFRVFQQVEDMRRTTERWGQSP